MIIQFVAILFAAFLALERWRHEKIEGQKIALAEEVLATFYEIKDLFKHARYPCSFGNEGKTREQFEEEDATQERIRNTYYVCIERLKKKPELISKISSLKYRFACFFGKNAMGPFDVIRQSHDQVVSSARNLIKSCGKKNINASTKAIEGWEKVIWFDETDDKIGRDIDAAVAAIEEMCRPLLSGQKPSLSWKEWLSLCPLRSLWHDIKARIRTAGAV